MIDMIDSERRRAFAIWLRTGRLPSVRNADGIELKFNPWHDPENGRFTFVGAGRYYGQRGSGGGNGRVGGGATGSRESSARLSHPKSQNTADRDTAKEPGRTPSPNNHAAFRTSARGAWVGGGFIGGGGGSFRGAGASGTWETPDRRGRPSTSQGSAIGRVSSDRVAATNRASAQSATTPREQFRTVVRNGYAYQIDSRERTRHVSGTLTLADVPIRSRTSQRQAGGVERRAGDDGGHDIAARFNGPTEAFNHFAQNANFNRGGYRLLEDEWAREKRARRIVTVKIVPLFDGGSARPSVIDVWWTVDGKGKSVKFPNQPPERNRGGR